MLNRLRASFAAKLLLGGFVFSLVIIGGVSAYLLVSRDSQTRAGALSNSDNRAAVMREVLLRFTGAQSYSTAHGLAAQSPLITALLSATSTVTVPRLFAGSPPVDLADEVLVIADRHGAPVYARADPALTGVDLAAFEQASVIRAALTGAACPLGGAPSTPGACGVELLAGNTPCYAVAVPVLAGATTVGVVSYIAPLQYQLDRFNALFQFPTAFIAANDPQREVRQRDGSDVGAAAPAAIAAGVAQHADVVHATYSAPSVSGGVEDVAGSFDALTAPDGHSIAGYLGVEVPLAPFVGDERTDELTLGLITLFALLLTAIAVIVFVQVVVRRPIHRLERGVARIAGGDYSSDVTVQSRDELGRLAMSVNRMRDSIRRYTTEIEGARARLDSNVERVAGVSRALTTTTGGIAALQNEVVRAAVAIAGGGAAALLAMRDGDTLVARAAFPPGSQIGDLNAWPKVKDLLAGNVVREDDPALGAMTALPTFYQGAVVGALVVATRAGHAVLGTDEEDVLAVLASNAAIAVENARLYEQEKETVRRLRELDAMKTDFLSTVQHELRTPLTAILGLSDLVEMCWDMWEDAPKLDAVRDIQVAARNLYDIVETIIDFSVLDGEAMAISPDNVAVDDAATAAVALVAERYKGGLPIPVQLAIPASASVYADADRFAQVLRALIDNAVKFSEGKGEVTVRAALVNRKRTVRIEVIDEGIGIADGDLPRVFERFFQADNTATRRYGGTGMGLALVKRIVLAHGATIRVDTEVGKGTRVIVEWPASASAHQRATSGDAAARPAPPPAVPVQ